MMTIARLAPQGHRVPLGRLRWLLACWCVVVLSAVGASAESCVTGVAPQGVSPQGMSRHRAGPPDAGLSPAAVPQQVELANPDLASTARKREQLTYLARCVLPKGVELYTQQGADRFTFPGRI